MKMRERLLEVQEAKRHEAQEKELQAREFELDVRNHRLASFLIDRAQSSLPMGKGEAELKPRHFLPRLRFIKNFDLGFDYPVKDLRLAVNTDFSSAWFRPYAVTSGESLELPEFKAAHSEKISNGQQQVSSETKLFIKGLQDPAEESRSYMPVAYGSDEYLAIAAVSRLFIPGVNG